MVWFGLVWFVVWEWGVREGVVDGWMDMFIY